MNSRPSIEKIKKDLTALRKFEVVVFGSYGQGTITPRSDIDIAIITRHSDPSYNKKVWKDSLSLAKDLYHISIFELLPLHVKASLMKNYQVLFGKGTDISEYFYHFRKLWKDERGRYEANQFSSVREKLSALFSSD